MKKYLTSSFRLTTLSIYNITWTVYCIIPLLFSFNNLNDSVSNIYLILASIFWFGGQLVGLHDNIVITSLYKIRIPFFRILHPNILPVFGFAASLFVVYFTVGDFSNIFSYKYNDTSIVRETSSFISSLPFITIGIFLAWLSSSRKQSSLLGILLIFFSSLLWMLLGLRNIASMLLISSMYHIFYGKKLSFRHIYIAAIAYLIASIVAVFREYSFLTLLDISNLDVNSLMLTDYILNYNATEFGTTFRSLVYIQNIQFQYPVLKSLILDPFINLLPSFIYPERGPTISVLLSQSYYGSNNLNYGLGFSFIAEAIAGFDALFIVPIFFAGYAIAKIHVFDLFVHNSDRPHLFEKVFLAAFAGASLNLLRIDFAIYFKFIILTFLFGSICLLLTKQRSI